MKTWKVLFLALGLAALTGCGTDKGDEASGPDCSNSPKLTKSCLEGTWEFSQAMIPSINRLKALDTATIGSAFPLEIVQDGSIYTLVFKTTKATRNLPNSPDSLRYTLGMNGESMDQWGTYTLSADSSAIILNLTEGEFDAPFVGNHTVRVYADSLGAILSWAPQADPVFSLPVTGVAKVSEIFYRAVSQ